jgi:hypothetical protein
MSSRKTPGSKAGRCVRLTTYHLLVPNVKKIRGFNLPDPHGPVQTCSGTVKKNTRVMWYYLKNSRPFYELSGAADCGAVLMSPAYVTWRHLSGLAGHSLHGGLFLFPQLRTNNLSWKWKWFIPQMQQDLATFYVLTAVWLKIQVFSNMTCHGVDLFPTFVIMVRRLFLDRSECIRAA